MPNDNKKNEYLKLYRDATGSGDIAPEEAPHMLAQALKKINPSESRVLCLYYGLTSDEPQSVEEIAGLFMPAEDFGAAMVHQTINYGLYDIRRILMHDGGKPAL